MSDQRGTIAAGLWSTFDLGLRFAVQFVVAITMAHLLSPKDFGVYALTGIFVGLAAILIDGGFSAALIQSKETSPELATSVFWYNIAVSVVLAAAIVAIAPLMARVYGYPVLRPLLSASAALVVINGLAAVPEAILLRNVRFDLIARAGVAATVVSAATGLTAALLGAGIWAFPAQALGNAISYLIILWAVSHWRPGLKVDFNAARKLARFGSFLTLSGLLEVLYSNTYSLIIGKIYGASNLGVYNRAQNLQAMPSNVIASIIGRMLLPLFSSSAENPERMRRGARLAIGSAMLVNVPLMAALAAVPDLVIAVLFGPKWQAAAPILRILAIGGLLFPLQVVNLQLLLAQGRSATFLKVEIAKKCAGIVCIATGSLFGIMGLAISQVCFAVIAFGINAYPAHRTLSYGPLRQLKDLAGLVFLTAVMIALVLALRPLLHLGNIVDLAVLAIVGISVFVVGALLSRVGVVSDLIAMTTFPDWPVLTKLGFRETRR